MHVDRRGQVSETMTWVIATIAILTMTFVFIFITGTIAEGKKVAGSTVVAEITSSTATQEMLFALLSYDSGKGSVKSFVQEGKYGELRTAVETGLDAYLVQGLNCVFSAHEQGKVRELTRTYKSTKAAYVPAGESEAMIVIGGTEVKLSC